MSSDWQEDCKRRVDTYQDLKSHGAHALDEKAIASARDCFERNSSGSLVPRPYASYGQPQNSVRYIAVALDGEEGGRDLRDAVAHVTAQVMGDLGENMEAYLNPPDTLHISVFHTGRPERPEWWRPLSSSETKEEKAKMTHLVESTGFSKGTFQVVVEDVVLASSGVLLLLMSSPDGLPAPVDELRAKCRETFTNANFKQATYVLHTSLARIVSNDGASKEQLCKLQAAVETASEKLKGTRACLRTVWYVEEFSMMACHGFGGQASDIAKTV